MTVTPGNYIRKIGDDIGFSTKFYARADRNGNLLHNKL